MAGDLLTMRETAGAVALSYERFRKVWPDLCSLDGFPAPVRGRVWLASAVQAWRVGQSMRPVSPGRMPRARVALPAATPAARQDPRRADRLQRQLAELRDA